MYQHPERRNHAVHTGSERADQEFEVVKGIDNPRLAELFPLEIEQLKMEVELVHGASHPLTWLQFYAGTQTPVFFGSAINKLRCP